MAYTPSMATSIPTSTTTMTTTAAPRRPVQHPILPWEITDAIIDHLQADVRALGVCSAVCAEWLPRSRHHIFTTVQLWPWRAHRFLALARAQACTFVHQIRCIEVDDSKTAPPRHPDSAGGGADERAGAVLPFFEVAAYLHLACFAQVRRVVVRNVDWTALALRQQSALRTRLGGLRVLDWLEMHAVVFHDMREVVRVLAVFPALYHLTANVSFMKVLEHTIASSMANRLPDGVRSLEVGTEEGVPVLLGSVAGEGRKPGSIRELRLHNIRSSHLQHIQHALEKAGSSLRHLSLGFELEVKVLKGTRPPDAECPTNPNLVPTEDDVNRALDFSRLSHLQTLRLEGLNFFQTPCMEERVSGILERIESSFLESIHLHVRMDVDDDSAAHMRKFNWCRIERALLALHFFGMKFVVIEVDIPPRGTVAEEEVESWIAGGMSDLRSRGALRVRVVREGSAVEVESSSGQSNVPLVPGTVLTISIAVVAKV